MGGGPGCSGGPPRVYWSSDFDAHFCPVFLASNLMVFSPAVVVTDVCSGHTIAPYPETLFIGVRCAFSVRFRPFGCAQALV